MNRIVPSEVVGLSAAPIRADHLHRPEGVDLPPELRLPDLSAGSRRIMSILAGILALIVALATYQIWLTYERVEAEAKHRMTIIAEAAAVYAGQVFGTAAHALESINAGPPEGGIVLPGSREDIYAILNRAQIASPAIRALALIGTDGRVLANWNSPWPNPTDLSDRPVYTAHRDDPDPRMRIGRPIAAPLPGNPVFITVSRRVVTPDGAFGGVVAARLSPAYFSAFFSKLGADSINLVDAEGTLYARYPEVELLGAPRRMLPAPETFGTPGYIVSSTTGRPRLADVTRVPGTKLFVLGSVPKSEIVGTWLVRAAGPAFVSASAALAVVIVGVWLRRRADAEAVLVAARAAAEHAGHVKIEHFKEIARRKTAFLAQMSHEIRTPLNAIIGFSDVIATDAMRLGGPARYREYAADIRFSADHLLGVIQRVLDLSKIEAGKWELRLERVEAGELVEDVRQLAGKFAEDEGVVLDTADVEPGLAFPGDRQALVQMLLNLVVNAIRFAGADRTVRVAAAHLADGRVEFRVVDRGPGMSAAEATRVVRPFETSGDPTVRRTSGTGLGLPLAKMFAELHGGELAIDSVPGQGTCVRAILPTA
jgi:two-component system, cell cycle sensor histidine kinase PleC